jgi:hypothetical protein
MIDYATCTQDDFGDDTFTEFNEGFVSYIFGHYLHENPYKNLDNDNDEEMKHYVMWFDGWTSAKECYPHWEPKEDAP